MDQDTGVTRNDADRVDGLPAALPVQELQGQGTVGEDVEPLGLAVDYRTNPTLRVKRSRYSTAIIRLAGNVPQSLAIVRIVANRS